MEIDTADSFVVEATVVFGWIVSKVVETWFPVDVKHALADAVTQPVESHVHCLGAFLFYCFVNDTGRRAIVSFKRGSGLRMPHFNQAFSEWDCFTSI